MEIHGTDDRYIIYGMLFELSNRIQTIGDQKFENITLKQQFMLIALQLFPSPPTLKEMADAVGCSYQNVKRMAEHLSKVGYLEIVSDEKDRRKLLLIPTAKVTQMKLENKEVIADFMDNLYKDISKEDLACTRKTLMAMNRNIGGNTSE